MHCKKKKKKKNIQNWKIEKNKKTTETTANITKKRTVNLFQFENWNTEGMIFFFFSFLKMGALALIWTDEGVSASPQSASNTTTEHGTDMRDYLQQ